MARRCEYIKSGKEEIFIFGPDVKALFLTLSLILLPMILFWWFVAEGLIDGFRHGYLLVAFSAVLTAYVIVLLLLTSGRDPGIIPRNRHPPFIPDDSDVSNFPTALTSAASSARMPRFPLTKSIAIRGTLVKVKFCQTCLMYRPPRCSHCSICNNCVERFDHHCPWVGQCIGKRNYRSFFMFVSSTSLLGLYILVSCSVNIKRIADGADCNMWQAIRRSPVSGILVLYSFVVCWFVGGLTVFHLYLISTNQTTYENFRYQYERRSNPYNMGCSRNFKEVFCAGIPPSRNNFREMVQSDPTAPPSLLMNFDDAEMESQDSFDEDVATRDQQERAVEEV
ncbi:probable protein S-acyltransferase 7 isoform X2 [Andrographis paniculata]|uniref:probable protein S-acyltransferase 7 isoform X2 n=1 Tax=Andrographis paniculata TaxID=175694 RepID=UPI0021E8CA1D|nr:probable protein S-acyltransferase 7 isoform X2 [Andrographis paniculata]